MIGVAELVGHADVGGKGVGFLVPVFRSRDSNALLVQRLGPDRKIAAFETVETASPPISSSSPERASLGEAAIWSFAFAVGDLLEAREPEFRAALQSRLEDLVFADRPLLSVEVAEFLDLADRRIVAAKKAYARLSTVGQETAAAWRDLSILTPDLQRAVASEGGDLALFAKRLIARVEGNTVVVRLPVLATEEASAKLAATMRRILGRLAPLYPAPSNGWAVRVDYPNPGPRTAEPEAIVLMPDRRDWEVGTLLEHGYGWRIDAYPMDQLTAFRRALSETRAAGFALIRGEGDSAAREIWDMAGSQVTPIVIGTNTRFHLLDTNHLLRAFEMPAHIYVPATGLPGMQGSTRNISTTTKQAIAATLGARDRIGPDTISGRWTFFRASGAGPDPGSDAIAALYDRLLANGLSGKEVFFMLGRHRKSREEASYPGWARQALFPEGVLLHDHRTIATMENSRTDAVMLLPAAPRGEHDRENHRRSVDQVLAVRGWRASPPRVGDGEPYELLYEIDVPLRLRYLRIEPESVTASVWNFPKLLARDLRELNAVALTGTANATSILVHLDQRGELAINMRDLCASTGEAGLWSIFGAQLRRLAGGQLHRSRSHFIALLINHAFRTGHPNFEEDGALYDAIHGETLGEEIQLSWSQVQYRVDHTRARVRLVAGGSNRYLSAGNDLIAPFDLILRSDGVALERTG